MTALETERHLHELMHSEVVMQDAKGKKLGEWYYEIQDILTAVETTRKEQIAIVTNVENLFYYISDEVGTLTRSKAKTVPNINPAEQTFKHQSEIPQARNIVKINTK